MRPTRYECGEFWGLISACRSRNVRAALPYDTAGDSCGNFLNFALSEIAPDSWHQISNAPFYMTNSQF